MAGIYGGPNKNNVKTPGAAGPQSSRKNTMNNQQSKGGGGGGGGGTGGGGGGGGGGYQNPGGAAAIPASTPDQTAAYYAQLQALQSQYSTTIADARLQRVGVNASFRTDKAAVKATGIANMAGTVNSAMDRGISGSSIDYQARIGVKADTANQIAGLKNQRIQDLGALQIMRQQAASDLYTGQTGLAAQQLAQQQAALAQQLETNAIISGAESNVNAIKQLYDALTAQRNNNKSAAGGAGTSSYANLAPVLIAPGQIGGRSTLPYYRNVGGVKG